MRKIAICGSATPSNASDVGRGAMTWICSISAPTKKRALGLDDAQRGLDVHRHRLLAEHRLARGEAGEHLLLVDEAGRGEQDRVHLT
jgi:hypothetical protein